MNGRRGFGWKLLGIIVYLTKFEDWSAFRDIGSNVHRANTQMRLYDQRWPIK